MTRPTVLGASSVTVTLTFAPPPGVGAEACGARSGRSVAARVETAVDRVGRAVGRVRRRRVCHSAHREILGGRRAVIGAGALLAGRAGLVGNRGSIARACGDNEESYDHREAGSSPTEFRPRISSGLPSEPARYAGHTISRGRSPMLTSQPTSEIERISMSAFSRARVCAAWLAIWTKIRSQSGGREASVE